MYSIIKSKGQKSGNRKWFTVCGLLLMVCCLTGGVAYGQERTNVEVKGEMVGSAGRKVELCGYSDMLTCREVLLDSCRVGADGKFSLRCFANYPRLVFLQVENYSQSFYVEPGRRYEVYVPDFDWGMDEQRNVFLDPVALPVEFLGVDNDELNLRISRFDERVDSFVVANKERIDFRYRPDKGVVKELEKIAGVPLGAGDQKEGFYERYVKYRVLEMELAMRLVSRKSLVGKHVENEPVRYYDENYMRFFLALYDHAVSGGTKKIGKHRLMDWVQEGNLGNYLDSIGLDPLLRNEQVRELAALEALKESYFDKDYEKEGVRRMVRLLGEGSKFEEHKLLAQRLLEMMEGAQGEQGVQTTHFELPDVEKRKVSLDDFRGKWVYLSFVRVGDPNSLKEIETMAHFRDTVYGENKHVEFVSIVCDREFQKMYHFLKSSRRGAKCKWTWLHFDGDYRMLEHFGVTCFPMFVLLDPEGRKVYDWTPTPGSGFLMKLAKMKVEN